MRASLRFLAATATGAVVAILLAYLGAIVLIVARMGIPLGSEGRSPTSGEYVGLLLVAGGAAAIGGHIGAGIARQHGRSVAAVLAAFLGVGALWGFTGSASNWPAWWAPALAAFASAGAWMGGTIGRPGSRAARPTS